MKSPYRWLGSIKRAPEGEGIVGELHDTFGFTIQIVGKRTDKGYEIVGTPGPVPEAYSLPGDEVQE